MSEEDHEDFEEIEIPDEDEEFEEITYVYGIPLPSLPEDLQPLECIVLIKGIMMSTGQPTITALGSEGLTPWEAAGMLQMESQRLIQGYVYGGISDGFFDEEDDEEEDD